MSDEADESTGPTIPDAKQPFTVYVSWYRKPPPEPEGTVKDTSGYSRLQSTARYEIPVSAARAKDLADVLNDYAKRCVAVKKALDVTGDGGQAYRDAQNMKHTEWSRVFSVMESILAHIAVNAK